MAKMFAEIVKVEQLDRYDPKYVKVTAVKYGLEIIFNVPVHRAKAYALGRKIEVSISIAK